MTRLFLDCEWADPRGEQLVSLALVSADGAHRFYAEMDPLPARPTDFVRNVVYPLLDRGAAKASASEFARRLRAFLAGISQPLVLFDHEQDGRLLARVLQGDLSHTPSVDALVVPTVLLSQGDITINIERYFEARPTSAARRHHALVDAEALAWAFRQVL